MQRYIAEYIGQGNFSPLVVEVASMTAKEAQTMLRSTFIVQEYINGGSLKDVVLSQVRSGCAPGGGGEGDVLQE